MLLGAQKVVSGGFWLIPARPGAEDAAAGLSLLPYGVDPVSYTHLTLPTILLV